MSQESQAVVQDILQALHDKLSIDLLHYEDSNSHIVRETVNAICKNLEPTIQERVKDEFFECGPLKSLLSDSTITEILVNGAANIWYERGGQLYGHTDRFLSDVTFRNFFERLFTVVRTEVTVNVPFVDGIWLNHRVHLVAPPVAPELTLSLRKKNQQAWSLSELQKYGWAESSQLSLLKQLVVDRKNLLIIGGTSSGKTTVLNSLLLELATNERTVIVEDTQELSLPNRVSARLLTRIDSKGLLQTITLQELVRQCLRMRPDRIIMGEVRGAEAKDLLMALATGHEGSMGTLHANSAAEALLRLEMLIQLGAPQWSLVAIRRLIQLALQYVVVVKRDSRSGHRYLEGIYRITSVEDFGIILEKA